MNLQNHEFSLNKMVLRVPGLLIFFLMIFDPLRVSANQIFLRLSGSLEFPGMMSMERGENRIGRICFLGTDAKGYLDSGFLKNMADSGVPEGTYRVSSALPGEHWPVSDFSENGALRFVPVSEDAVRWFAQSGKKGLVIHGSDFFPLAEMMTHRSEMVRFFSDRLFQKLSALWGALRITNWDMGRLYDYYSANTRNPSDWEVKVVREKYRIVKQSCEPLKVQRKPGGAPE